MTIKKKKKKGNHFTKLKQEGIDKKDNLCQSPFRLIFLERLDGSKDDNGLYTAEYFCFFSSKIEFGVERTLFS